MRAVFVGRDTELAELVRYLDGALEGHPSVVLCRGEPGIGKTRLAEELTSVAAGRNFSTAWGTAVESDAPPYWPWRQILRELPVAATHPDLAGLTDSRTAESGKLSSEDRFRQFDAVGRLIAESAADNPVVIVFDDAHWADRPSVLLLQHLARTLRDERLLLIVNHRDTEHEHAARFADLLREPVTRQIDLRGLTTPAVAMQLASVVGRDVDQPDAEQVRA
jgi:predicted ATPase